MQNLLTSQQIRKADAHTISTKLISSLDLMEAASSAFVEEFKKEAPDKNLLISIFCGTRNNGGDGLAIARLLWQDGYENISVKIIPFSKGVSNDFNSNLERLKKTDVAIDDSAFTEKLLPENPDVIIDALLGSGVNKPVDRLLKQVVQNINSLGAKIISVDVPSGLKSEGIIDPDATTIKAELAISFQLPKINFFFPETSKALERFKAVNIGLDDKYIQTQASHWRLIEEKDIRMVLKPRKPFSHKGTYGHALIIAGCKETMGAALLCADACLYSGAGLTTACIPESGLIALNTRSPEIMALIRNESIPTGAFENYSAIALGPGLGNDEETTKLLKHVLTGNQNPMVLDADALTILSRHQELFSQLPAMSILTPHMKEFDRMFGPHSSWWERVETARQKASEFNIIILLKNQYSFIVLPDGNVLINPTGNPAMAVGGMGDVLTGMIAAFLAQGYAAKDAAILACYLHGKTGDGLKKEGMSSIPPRHVIQRLPFVIDGLY
ncbi:MAG: NAD(P)H-hydrate dehydratase [Daejeonella sp.]|uniref:NAD(P)H-hydrate dehydratase n=1 Tax=Daejeonella sp. JGW-45 TaxID=3034148 RepID=UPI0023EB7310|nr:NAD(P)H-hydrate dehydratase [Daejeonella sp. JGW-45]